jgi:hypothetical protein
MNKSLLVLIFLLSSFCSFCSFAQGTYGFTYGQGMNEDTNFNLNLDYSIFFDVSENLGVGPYLSAGGTFFKIGSNQDELIIKGEIGVGARYYITEAFKVNLIAGYGLPINESTFYYDDGVSFGSQEIEIKGSVFTKLYLELFLDSVSIIAGPSLSFGSPIQFHTFNVGVRFNSGLL